MRPFPLAGRVGRLFRFLVCMAASYGFHAIASAQVVNFPNNAVYDTQTGLIWRVWETGTWADAAAAAPPGVRLATVAELLTLFDHAGIQGSGSGTDPGPEGGAVIGLIDQWGCVLCTRVVGADMWLADPGPEPGTHALASLFFTYDGAANLYHWTVHCCGFVPDDQFEPSSSGAAYVSNIPEPQTWALLLLGGLALAPRLRRQRQRNAATAISTPSSTGWCSM